jgi:hypothetical protein
MRDTYSYSPALLNPNPRCPEFLQARRFNGGGLGHSFMAFNNLVSIASAHNVTTKAHFTSTGHGMNGSVVDAFFFGDFFDVKTTVNGGLEHTLSELPNIVNCSNIDDFSMLLAKNRAKGCHDNAPKIYLIDAAIPPREGNIDMRLYRDGFAHREAYRTSYVTRQPTQAIDTAGPGEPRRPCTRVAVHIRRGDITRNPSMHDLKHRGRWVPNRAYLHVIDALHRALSTRSGHHERGRSPGNSSMTTGQHSSTAGGAARISCRLCIELYVEGATSASAVPDADLENTQGFTNFRDRLAEYGSVNIITSDALLSFSRACNSEILITGKSGYSHLMSILCDSPLILAFPMWHSYSNLPNAMMVSTFGRDKTWIDGASFNETAFMNLADHKGLTCKIVEAT